jgi:hypothetical protein
MTRNSRKTMSMTQRRMLISLRPWKTTSLVLELITNEVRAKSLTSMYRSRAIRSAKPSFKSMSSK